jgi:hypothetical protein
MQLAHAHPTYPESEKWRINASITGLADKASKAEKGRIKHIRNLEKEGFKIIEL